MWISSSIEESLFCTSSSTLAAHLPVEVKRAGRARQVSRLLLVGSN